MDNILLNLPNYFKNSFLDQQKIQSLFDYRCVLSLGDPLLLLSCGVSLIKNMIFQTHSIDFLFFSEVQFLLLNYKEKTKDGFH